MRGGSGIGGEDIKEQTHPYYPLPPPLLTPLAHPFPSVREGEDGEEVKGEVQVQVQAQAQAGVDRGGDEGGEGGGDRGGGESEMWRRMYR